MILCKIIIIFIGCCDGKVLLLGLGDPSEFLAACLQPPSRQQIDAAISRLEQMGAVHWQKSEVQGNKEGCEVRLGSMAMAVDGLESSGVINDGVEPSEGDESDAIDETNSDCSSASKVTTESKHSKQVDSDSHDDDDADDDDADDDDADGEDENNSIRREDIEGRTRRSTEAEQFDHARSFGRDQNTPIANTDVLGDPPLAVRQLQLTALGVKLAHLPMDVRLGKLLIVASLLGCLSKAVTVAAALSGKSPFSFPPGAANAARLHHLKYVNILESPPSDHLAVVRAFDGWQQAFREGGSDAAAAYCRKNYLSSTALYEIRALREQYLKCLEDAMGKSTSFKNEVFSYGLETMSEQLVLPDTSLYDDGNASIDGGDIRGKCTLILNIQTRTNPPIASSHTQSRPEADATYVVATEKLEEGVKGGEGIDNIEQEALLLCAITAGLVADYHMTSRGCMNACQYEHFIPPYCCVYARSLSADRSRIQKAGVQRSQTKERQQSKET